MSDWSDEETDDPVYADRRNFYKVEKWSRDWLRVELMLYAGTVSAEPARNLRARSDIRLNLRQRCGCWRSGRGGGRLSTSSEKREDLNGSNRQFGLAA